MVFINGIKNTICESLEAKENTESGELDYKFGKYYRDG